jgi:hypothetical protein
VPTNEFGLKAKLFLICFGLALGLGAVEIASGLIKKPSASEFESLEDLRRTMLAEDSERDPTEGSSLRAIINPHLDDRIIYDLRPNLNVKFQGVPVRTNSCGMRSPERTVQKQTDTFRLALLGDSFTFGWGVQASHIFPQVLEDNLNRIGAGRRKAEVLNFGVPGYSTFQETSKFLETGLDFNPDAVLIFFIENDFALPFYVRDVYNPGQMLSSSTFVKLSSKLMDDKLREHNMQLKGFDANSALRDLAQVLSDRGIKLYLTFNPKKGWKKWREKLWVLDNRTDINVLDLHPDMVRIIESRQIDKKDLSLPTDPHPSALKHRLLGDLLTPYFMEAVS